MKEVELAALFLRYSGKEVFFGRDVPVLGAWAAFLVSTNRMPWPSFLRLAASPGPPTTRVGGYYLGRTCTGW